MNKQEHEILNITIEECSEVSQAITKIFRFGLDTEWNGETNREHLEEEVGDLQAMLYLLAEFKIIDNERMLKAAEKKLEKLKKWSNIEFKDK